MDNEPVYSELLNDVVKNRVFDREGKKISAEFCCPSGFPAFDGHFPEQPVLPAVIQLALVRVLSSELLGMGLEPERTERLKFKSMIRPEEKVRVDIELGEEEELWRAEFNLNGADGLIANGTIYLKNCRD